MKEKNLLAVDINEIMIDSELDTRIYHDPNHIKRIAEGIGIGLKPDPLLVTKSGKYYVLLGGHNRLEAWKLAFADNPGKVFCRTIECDNFEDMLYAALMDNRQNGKSYHPNEIKNNYYRLINKYHWSKKRAHEALGISEEHGLQYDTFKILPATSEVEATMPDETPGDPERAISHEIPTQHECAMVPEKTTEKERAISREIPTQHERALYNTIDFHIMKLREHIPEEWTEARANLDMLAESIIKTIGGI